MNAHDEAAESPPQPDATTLAAYDRDAQRYARDYEAVDRSALVARVRAFFPGDAQVLELGCGSGADAAALETQGLRMTPTDGSLAMLAVAAQRHPALASRFVHAPLPGPLPFADGAFDGVLAIAVLQHLTLAGVKVALVEIARVLRVGGRAWLSVFDTRDDCDAHARESAGRLMTPLPVTVFAPALRHAGLDLLDTGNPEDLLGRSGIATREYRCMRV